MLFIHGHDTSLPWSWHNGLYDWLRPCWWKRISTGRPVLMEDYVSHEREKGRGFQGAYVHMKIAGVSCADIASPRWYKRPCNPCVYPAQVLWIFISPNIQAIRWLGRSSLSSVVCAHKWSSTSVQCMSVRDHSISSNKYAILILDKQEQWFWILIWIEF